MGIRSARKDEEEGFMHIETNMDRRSFLKGALATAGAGVLAGAGLSGCSPAGNGSSSEQAQSEEGATSQAALGKDSIERKEGSETREADAVVVGAGAAGLMAALALTRAGKHVIVVEKGANAFMSNFSVCGGPAACETKLQEEEGETVTLDTLFNYMYDFSRSGVNGKLLRGSLACTSDALNTMIDLGIKMSLWPDVYGNGFRARHYLEDEGEDRVQPIVDEIEGAGGEFMYSAAGQKIIMENGTVAGLQTESGVDVKAPCVVVCTGGFLGSEALQRRFFNTPVFALGNTMSDGTGIAMVVDAGGALDRNFAIGGNECGAVSQYTEGWPFDEEWHNLNEHYGYWLFGGLYTDTSGERFIDEKKIADYPLAIGGEASVRAGKCYVVMDDDYYQGVQEQGIYAYLGKPESWASGEEADFYSPTKENAETHLQQAIDQGWARKADTVAELAQAFNLANLEETVEEYNKYCDEGKDEEFGKDPAFLKPVKKAPFYIFEYVPSAWTTIGGVKVDSCARAVDSDNNAIPGLYVAGVDQGSAYSMPYYTNPGACVGIALGSGMYAGQNAAEYLG